MKVKQVCLTMIVGCLILLNIVRCTQYEDTEKSKTISDIVYQKYFTKDFTVYLYEDDKLVPYLVLDKNYGDSGNTLLLRKYILSEIRNMNDETSYYPQSLMDVYLNEEYLKELKIQDMVCDTDILVTKYIMWDGLESITRKVFLLSATETGNHSEYSMWKEGEEIAYFSDQENREASREDGELCTWWLRTRELSYDVCTFVQGRQGYCSGGDCKHNQNGVRPAFCIPSDTPISQIESEEGTIYIIQE